MIVIFLNLHFKNTGIRLSEKIVDLLFYTDEGNVPLGGGYPPAISRVKEMMITRRGGV